MTTQLVLSKEGCAHWYFLAASPIEGGTKDQCFISAIAVSNGAPELPHGGLIFDVPPEAGLAVLKKLIVQLPGNRGFKEALEQAFHPNITGRLKTTGMRERSLFPPSSNGTILSTTL
jgi:hypothetical protein